MLTDMSKKNKQLNMNYSTASNRLVKDILFSFVHMLGMKCYRCHGDLTRETISIEHKEPWLDSEDPVKLFFDLRNIWFSHKMCNLAAARKPRKGRGQSIESLRKKKSAYMRRVYDPATRRAKYLTRGQ